jgi:hypothetical protein
LGRAWSIGQSGIYSAPGGCWRFWARRARISIDILGLGATSRQGGWFWGGVLRSKLKEQAKEASDNIRFRLEL